MRGHGLGHAASLGGRVLAGSLGKWWWAPACKSYRRHRGVRHWCSWHHEGHPQVVPAAGGAQQCTLFKMGGVCALPTPQGGGGRR